MTSRYPDLPKLTWDDIRQALLFLAVTPEQQATALHFIEDLEDRAHGLSGVQLMTEMAATAGLIVRVDLVTGPHLRAGSFASSSLSS